MTDTELAAYIVSLEERVNRLKTLEDQPQTAAGAWTFIIETELAVASSFVIFGSIPQTYDDLMLLWLARSSTAGVPNRDRIIAQFNGDTTAGNYDTIDTSQNASSNCDKDSGYVVVSHVASAASTGDANSFSAGLWYIPEYTSTAYKKTTEGWGSCPDLISTFGLNSMCNGCWSKTPEAITTFKLYLARGGNFLADSRFELYGLTR